MDDLAQEIFEYSRRGRIEEVREVLGRVHPDTYTAYDGSTALLMACKNGHDTICELLIQHGADPSLRTDDGSSSLFLACCSGNVCLVQRLLHARAEDINAFNEDGLTPLDVAMHYSHSEVVKLLIRNGGKPSGIVTPESGEVEAGPSEKWGYGVFDQ